MKEFEIGQKVFWVREGWAGTYRIPATVVKINSKTITIDAELKNGGTKRRNVKPENLVSRDYGFDNVYDIWMGQ